MYKYCYLNDRFLSERRAGVSVWDIGLQRGFGVFDLTMCYQGTPFHLSDHLKRLKRSAKRLGLKAHHTNSEIIDITKNLLVKNKVKNNDCCLRILLTGGVAKNGLDFDAKKPTLVITLEPVPAPAEKNYRKGAKLMTCEYQRVLPQAKTTNYLQAVALQPEKNKQRALEILYYNDGHLLEASTSNFFLVKNGRISTPYENILLGITRQITIKLAQRAGWTVEERDVVLSELEEADEAFITASNKEVVPVVQVDDQVIGGGQVGEVTKDLMDRFSKYRQDYIKREKRRKQ